MSSMIDEKDKEITETSVGGENQEVIGNDSIMDNGGRIAEIATTTAVVSSDDDDDDDDESDLSPLNNSDDEKKEREMKKDLRKRYRRSKRDTTTATDNEDVNSNINNTTTTTTTTATTSTASVGQNQEKLVPIQRRFEFSSKEWKMCMAEGAYLPRVALSRYSRKARYPRPTYDTKDYGVSCPHRSYFLFPIYEYTIVPGEVGQIDTGWNLHAYPAATHTLYLRLTSSAVSLGVSTSLTSLDPMMGQRGKMQHIRVPLRNNNPPGGKNVYIHPEDMIFEICLMPKVSFCIDDVTVFRIPQRDPKQTEDDQGHPPKDPNEEKYKNASIYLMRGRTSDDEF